MATTPVCTIDATGIHAPEFGTVMAFFQNAYRAIYGADIVLDNATQDGQWVALIATALNDANAQTIAAYGARSPAGAQFEGLSSLVKLNGLRRKPATFSTVDLRIIGQARAEIVNGLAESDDGVQWALPALVTIPDTGEITVTAACLTLGAITAPADTIAAIATPTFGWQSVTNPSPAVPGQSVESDAQLRRRQAVSTSIAAQSLFESLHGALLALSGVTRVKGYENDTNYPDANGLPGHAVCFVVEGGDANAIAALIARKKGGAGTYGTTAVTVTDATGQARRIAFSRPSRVPITYALTVRSLGGYTQGVDALVKQSLADWTDGLDIGADVDRDAAYVPARLNNAAPSRGYEILSLAIGRNGQVPTEASVPLAYDERATCSVEAVTVTILR